MGDTPAPWVVHAHPACSWPSWLRWPRCSLHSDGALGSSGRKGVGESLLLSSGS